MKTAIYKREDSKNAWKLKTNLGVTTNKKYDAHQRIQPMNLKLKH